MKRSITLILLVGAFMVSQAQVRPLRYVNASRAQAVSDSLLRNGSQAADEITNFIVEFKDEPLFVARRNSHGLGKSVSSAVYESRFARFVADADAIRRSVRPPLSSAISVRHTYYKAFFGVSASGPSWMLPLIQHLSYVKAIHFDREVRATIDQGVTLIGAPASWATFGTKGEGVRVGIIDSGIDYLHPALGGGFGPGFKVAGGYDFVNNDGDPMDDNGHGTHVAGIVAADLDSIQGVAPKATLYAYKALDAQGSALESIVIEAIERTVDPNQDGDDNDHLDVVNMSLGTNGGSPTDASSIAVNNAIQLGVVFCIAAGNRGGPTPVEGKEDNFFYDGSSTISSPGTAELAITVGASDGTDNRARFSSKGPNRISFSIKPEVLAPGVDITSTYLASGYATLSGTSMATPFITGVAALVKSLRPGWGPALIKSTIVNTAKNVGLGAYLQGGGRVRALQALSTKTLVVPSTLSCGMDDPSAGTWIQPETLYIANKHTLPQSYDAVVGLTLPGVTLEVSPRVFAVPADDSVPVVVTLLVNNAQVLNQDDDILRFSGTVSFNGTVDSASVPWAFTRTNRLVVTTSEPNAFFLGYSNNSAFISTGSTVNWTSPTRAEVYAPGKGIYEFFALFPNPAGISRIVINEGVDITSNASQIFIDGANAIHPLIYHGVDDAGNPLHAYRNPHKALIAGLPKFGDWITTFSGGADTVLLSTISAAHSFKPLEFQIDVTEAGTMHVVQYDRFNGMNGTRTVTNSPADFIREKFKVKIPPGTPAARHITFLYAYSNTDGAGGFMPMYAKIDTVIPGHDEYDFTGYIGKSSRPTDDVAVQFYTSYSDVQHLSIDYQSGFVMPYKDSIVAIQRDFVSPAVPRFESGSTITLGGSPIHLRMVWLNHIIGANTLHFRTLFRGMLNEDRNIDVLGANYTLFDKNGEALFTKSLADPRPPLELTADWYKAVITSSNHWLRNARGAVTLTTGFNLGNGFDSNPPSITSLMVLDTKGRPTDSLAKGDKATLQFSFSALRFGSPTLPIFDSTRAWYRKTGTITWMPLAVTKLSEVVDNEGMIAKADLGAATLEDSVAIDLRMATADSNGFSADYCISPAFAVGSWSPASVTVVEPPGRENMPGEFTLEQNFPNPFNPTTIVGYQLAAISDVKLVVYDILGREVATLVNEIKQPGFYSVHFDGTHLAGGVYFYRLQAGNFVRTRKLLLLK